MPFPHQGENHYSGILNEKQLSQFLDKESILIGPFIKKQYIVDPGTDHIQIEHQGGTKSVDDAKILNNTEKVGGISYKNHKTGTFDWINTTKNIPLNEELREKLIEFKTSSAIQSKEEFIEKEIELRNKRDEIMNSYIKNFTSPLIKDMLQNIYNEYSQHIVITLCNEKKYLYYQKTQENFKEFVGFPEWKYYIKETRAKNSAQIWRLNESTQEDVNTGLRIRLTLNNGLNAFFGLSTANKNSYPCIKIQQEKIDDLYIPSLTETLIEDFKTTV